MRCAIYVRVSTDREEQASSIAYQRQYFENYVREKGWDIHNFYVDIESGTKKNRKELKLLIEDARKNKFDIILTKELSRLARNQGLALEIKQLIENHGIHLVTMDNAINTLQGQTQLFGFFAWMYEEESQRTSNRIKMALNTRAKNGFYRGSNAPYGYKVEKGKLIVADDETPEVVKRIYKLYLDGKGFDAIARVLYEEGFRTPSQVANKKNESSFWHGSSVRKILENPNYTGDLVQGRTTTISVTNKKRKEIPNEEHIIIQNCHEAIISKEDFEAVQKLIESRRQKSVYNPSVNSKVHENVHLFTGIVYCNDCGSAFHYKKNRKGYICGRYNKHGNKACSDHHVLEDTLKAVIRNDLKKLSTNLEDDIQYLLIKDKLKKERGRLERELKSMNSKIEYIAQFKNKALTKYISDDITKDEYEMFIASKDTELKELENRRNRIEKILSDKVDDDVISKVKLAVARALDFEDITREIINRFIEKIVIKADGTIKIFYRFQGSTKILNELMG